MRRSNINALVVRTSGGWHLNKVTERRNINWFDHTLIKTITADVRFGHLFDVSKLTVLKHSVKYKNTYRNVRTKKALCVESGRSRGFNQFTGLSRFRFKEFVERGILPGMYRASW